jgi:hypothetical protein
MLFASYTFPAHEAFKEVFGFFPQKQRHFHCFSLFSLLITRFLLYFLRPNFSNADFDIQNAFVLEGELQSDFDSYITAVTCRFPMSG